MIGKYIEKLVRKSYEEIMKELGADIEISVDSPIKEEFGDYTAVILYKMLPRDIRADIAKNIRDDKGIFAEIEFKPPVFINFFLKPEYLLENLKQILKQKEKYGQSKLGKGKTIVIDYSAPNIAKPFGIGHLRSTVIGQAIYNLYKFLGYKCVGDNHLGDWGTQFGKLIFQIELKIKNEKLKIKELTIDDLEKLYVEFHQKAKENPQLEDEARAWFKKLEQGDKKAKEIWQACWDISMKEFNRIYDLLRVEIDYILGESFYQDKMKPVFEEMKQKGLTNQSESAWVVEFPGNKLPSLVLVKSDGATTYFLRDLATIKYRLKKWKPSIIAYEVGVDQSLYFKQLFKTIEMLGWTKDVQFEHIIHGLMRSKTGKFSTRQGDTIHLEDVLNEAIDKAKEIIEKSETNKGLSQNEKLVLANQVGIGAVKYNDLSQHHSRDIIFDWDKILNLKGNSGPYLQYVYARCQSVLEKSSGNRVAVNSKINFSSLQEIEKTLLKKLFHFKEVIKQSANSFSPNLICNYTFDLSQSFNLFYNEIPILKADTKEQKEFRLALTFGVGQVVKNGLTLLGIETPKKM
ncbi:MAG: arginine--tRNA ligase [Candidatus Pacebacteria bacterium]|nr:arginine--tRNA ligase [Candidatus Paceibacterota bacterium]